MRHDHRDTCHDLVSAATAVADTDTHVALSPSLCLSLSLSVMAAMSVLCVSVLRGGDALPLRPVRHRLHAILHVQYCI